MGCSGVVIFIFATQAACVISVGVWFLTNCILDYTSIAGGWGRFAPPIRPSLRPIRGRWSSRAKCQATRYSPDCTRTIEHELRKCNARQPHNHKEVQDCSSQPSPIGGRKQFCFHCIEYYGWSCDHDGDDPRFFLRSEPMGLLWRVPLNTLSFCVAHGIAQCLLQALQRVT